MPIRRSPSAAGSAKQPGSRSSIRLSTHVGRPMMELFEVGFAVRSDRLSPSHGENRGSSPLGSANEIKQLIHPPFTVLGISPFFLQVPGISN